PPFIAPGAQVAVLEGNPAASTGDFTIRIKMPAGYRIAPHWHLLRENVTVISGTFKVGMGDTFEASKMGTFPAGSFAFLDPDMHHYAMAASDVVVQIHGTAPVQFNYINPQDDPSKKASSLGTDAPALWALLNRGGGRMAVFTRLLQPSFNQLVRPILFKALHGDHYAAALLNKDWPIRA